MTPRDPASDEAQVREMLRGIEAIGSPTHAERERIRGIGWAAFERAVNGEVDDERSSSEVDEPLSFDSSSTANRSRRGPGRVVLAAAASVVLLAGFAAFVVLRQPGSGDVDVADTPTAPPVVVLPEPTESSSTRYTLRVGGLDVAFESDVAATFGESGDHHAWIVATEYDAPFDGPTRYGQVLLARPTSIFEGDPATWFESNGIDAQEVVSPGGGVVGWSLIVSDASRCNGDYPCVPFATFADNTEKPALAAGVINEVRIVDVGNGDPFLVFTSTFGPRGSTSFAAARQLQDDIVRSLQQL